MAKKNLRSVLFEARKANVPIRATIDERNLKLDSEELAAVRELAEALGGKSLPSGRCDRHSLHTLLVEHSTQPPTVCMGAAYKLADLIKLGVVPSSLQLKGKILTESALADALPDNPDGDDVGMLGVGNDGELPEEHGDADKGADQNKDSHGDKSGIASHGYMEEDDDEDKPPFLKTEDEEDPEFIKNEDEQITFPEEKPVYEGEGEDGETWADDATHKDGTGQNEKLGEDHTSLSNETDDVEKHPDYDHVDKVNADGELDKGPSEPGDKAMGESLSVLERIVVGLLREAKIKVGTPEWKQKYMLGIQRYYEARISQVIKRLTEDEAPLKPGDHLAGSVKKEDEKPVAPPAPAQAPAPPQQAAPGAPAKQPPTAPPKAPPKAPMAQK